LNTAMGPTSPPMPRFCCLVRGDERPGFRQLLSLTRTGNQTLPLKNSLVVPPTKHRRHCRVQRRLSFQRGFGPPLVPYHVDKNKLACIAREEESPGRDAPFCQNRGFRGSSPTLLGQPGATQRLNGPHGARLRRKRRSEPSAAHRVRSSEDF